MKLIFPLLTVTTIFLSCKKEKDLEILPETTIQNSISDYGSLGIGNYWVYDNYNINTELNDTITFNYNDSIYIDRDTLINGHRFFVMEGKLFNLNFERIIRVNGDKLENPDGYVYLKMTNSVDTLYKQLWVDNIAIDSIYYVSQYNPTTIRTELGHLNSEYQLVRTFFNNTELTEVLNPRYDLDCYVKDVGAIKYTGFLGWTNSEYHAILKSYSVQ